MVNRLFQTARALVNRQQTNILSAASIIMAMVLTSRILGLVRNWLLNHLFTPNEVGVYFASFRLPNLVFEILVIGTVSTAFIPVFSEQLSKGNEKKAFAIASSVINLASLALLLLLVPLLIFTPHISRLFAPGFSEAEIQQMIPFTRIMLAAQVLPLLFGNFLTGILQSYKHFLLPALAPVVYNLGIILGIIFLSPFFGLKGVVFGVVIGALFFVSIQIPQVRSLSYQHFLKLNFKDLEVQKIFKLAGPRTLSLGIAQIDSTIDLYLTSLLGASSVAYFSYAQQLQKIPIGLFGLTIAQATLPTLSQKGSLHNNADFKKTVLASWHQILFLVLPASAILTTLRIPTVRLLLGARKFDWIATVTTAETLSFFAISLFAQSSVHLFIRAFFALQDSKTPVITTTIAVLTTSILSIYFVQILSLPVWSLGLSASIGAFVNAGLLLYFLNKKVGFDLYQIIVPPLKMFAATGIMVISVYIPKKLLDILVFQTERVFELILFTGTLTFIGLSVYAFMAWFLNIKEVLTFYNLLKRVIRVKDLFFETSTEVVHGEETL